MEKYGLFLSRLFRLTRLPAAASLHCEIPVTLFPDGALKLGRQGRVMSLGHLSEAALPELWHQGAGRTLGDGQGIVGSPRILMPDALTSGPQDGHYAILARVRP